MFVHPPSIAGSTMKILKLVKLNNLQYNPNRDPNVYRRSVNKEFRLQAILDGTGSAKGIFLIDGKPRCESAINLPGTFECKFKFPKAGTHVGELVIEGNGETYHQNIRIDVTEYDWIG